MVVSEREIIDDASLWYADELSDPSSFTLSLDEVMQGEVLDAVHLAQTSGTRFDRLTAEKMILAGQPNKPCKS